MRESNLLTRLATVSANVAMSQSVVVGARVESVLGQALDVAGFGSATCIGQRLGVMSQGDRSATVEIVGFRDGKARALSFDRLQGIGAGSRVLYYPFGNVVRGASFLAPTDAWLGRVIDPLGRSLDGKGPLPVGPLPRDVRAAPPQATRRARLGERIEFGVSVLDVFATCRTGQRLGLFAGSGVGKSTLLAMLANHASSDVVVLALVGERGREVRDFVEDELGADGLSRSVVVAATSDASALMRREAAYAAMTVAEHYRDQGRSVLLLMDSLTRFCLALREIGLAAGEVPATRGYPPSVFAELPCLLERAGPGPIINGKAGQITALLTVLVEGDDHDEPITDAVRGILDGHVVLNRRIAEAGRYPAIDVSRSLSRTVPGCLASTEWDMVTRARALLSTYGEVADLVRLGAYKSGMDPHVDEAVLLAPRIEAMLRQPREEFRSSRDSFTALSRVLEVSDG